MPASRNASPCSSHHRPTVPSSLALGERLVGEVAGHFFGREIDVGKDHDAALAAARSPARPSRLRGRRKIARGSGSPFARAWRSDAETRRGWSGTCDDRDWPSRGPADSAARIARAPARLRLCQYSRSAAKNRSQAQSVPISSAAAANNCDVHVESRPRLVAKLRCAAAERFEMPCRRGDLLRRRVAAAEAGVAVSLDEPQARRRRARRARRADTWPPRAPMTCSASADASPSAGGNAARHASTDRTRSAKPVAAAVDDHRRKHAERMPPNARLGRRSRRRSRRRPTRRSGRSEFVVARAPNDRPNRPAACRCTRAADRRSRSIAGLRAASESIARATQRAAAGCVFPSELVAMSDVVSWPTWHVLASWTGQTELPLLNYTVT